MSIPKNTPAAPASILPAGFKSIVMTEPSYDLDSTKPAIGYLVEHVAMPDAKVKNDKGEMVLKPWNALRFVATHPVECVDREENKVTVPVGGRFFIGNSAALDRNDLIAAALNPQYVREVFVKCTGKKALAGGRSFREFEIGLTDEFHLRSIPALANVARPAVLPAAAQLAYAQLPAAQVNGQASA